jgi:thiol-disulfide isomerase/thioredoxin
MKSAAQWIVVVALAAVACPSGAQRAPAVMPAHAGAHTPYPIDAQAMARLKRNEQAMAALRTYSAECVTILTQDVQPAKGPRTRHVFSVLKAAKPNKMRYDCWELIRDPGHGAAKRPSGTPTYTFACDGKNDWKQYGKTYRKDDHVKPGAMTTILEPWTGFYVNADSVYSTASEARKKNELREVRSLGRESVDGVPCEKVRVAAVSTYNGETYDSRATWYLGPDNLVRRCVAHVSFGGKPGVTRDSTLRHIRVDAPIGRRVYAYSPPPGVSPAADRSHRPALLANGSHAPNFSAEDARKRPVKLSNYRGKVVIVDFWASWCGPCMASMPHNQEVMAKLKAQRLPVVLLAVDDGEPREDFDAWVSQKASGFSALTFVHSPPSKGVSAGLFRVTGIPTQYVLDKRGIVRASFEGYGGPSDALEQAVRAALKGK